MTEGSTLRRNIHPGAGASTSYNNFTFISNKDITAGQELFASIGDAWFTYQQEQDPTNTFPLRKDFEYVDKLLSELNQLRSNNNLTDAQFLGMFQSPSKLIFLLIKEKSQI